MRYKGGSPPFTRYNDFVVDDMPSLATWIKK